MPDRAKPGRLTRVCGSTLGGRVVRPGHEVWRADFPSPSAEVFLWSYVLLPVLRASSRCSSRSRSRSRSRAAAASSSSSSQVGARSASHRLAFAHLHRRPVRDRRRSRGRRRRRRVGLSADCAAHEAVGLPAERRSDRRLPPGPGRDLRRESGLSGSGAAEARHPGRSQPCGAHARPGLRTDRPGSGRPPDTPRRRGPW